MVGTRRVKWGLELNSQGHRLGYTCIVQSLSFQVKKLGTDKMCSLWQEDLGIYEEVYLKLGETPSSGFLGRSDARTVQIAQLSHVVQPKFTWWVHSEARQTEM